jgi:hypothetical protein
LKTPKTQRSSVRWSADPQTIRGAAEAIRCDHPASNHAKVLLAFCAVWLDADVTAADDLLCHSTPQTDTSPFHLSQVVPLTIHRLNGDVVAAERIADELGALGNPPWARLSQSAMTRRLAPPR